VAKLGGVGGEVGRDGYWVAKLKGWMAKLRGMCG
jgi:hypothetical protein